MQSGGYAQAKKREKGKTKRGITTDRHGVLLAKRCKDPITSQVHNSMLAISHIDFFKKSIEPRYKYYDCWSVLEAVAASNVITNIHSPELFPPVIFFTPLQMEAESKDRAVVVAEGDTSLSRGISNCKGASELLYVSLPTCV